MSRPTPTGTMEERAARALYQTWQQIAGDVLAGYAEEEGKDVDRVVISRPEVIDCVTSCGYAGGYPETYGGDKEAVAWLDSQPLDVQRRVCVAAFPHARYGT
jgi:hypothetical protein